MNDSSVSPKGRHSMTDCKPWRASAPSALAISASGLAAGTLDIAAASIINHVSPVLVLQAIASGVLGRSSFHQGLNAAFLGLMLQLLMSMLIAAIFWSGARLFRRIDAHPFAFAIAYGLVIYSVMTFIVVPLSRAKPSFPNDLRGALPDLFAMVLFGLVIATATLQRRNQGRARSR